MENKKTKKERVNKYVAESQKIGDILLGFAVLMFGMQSMSGAVAPLKDSPAFIRFMTAFSNPLLGILVGAVFTAILQSASAAVGILQALSVTGAIEFAEGFPILGKSRSRWLAYNMAMRARVFDDWTDSMRQQNRDALVLHIGCGLDSRCTRIKQTYREWTDCDLPEVIAVRRRYYEETDCCHMAQLDASDPNQIAGLPDSDSAVVLLEGLSMYLTNEQLHALFQALQKKYRVLHILMDVYTPFGAKASKCLYKAFLKA